MKKYVLITLLLMCFLIASPAAVVSLELTEVNNTLYYLHTPELFSIQEEITTNIQGEVFSYSAEETNNSDIDFINIPLLEFVVIGGNYTGINEIIILPINYLCKTTYIIGVATYEPGSADLFCFGKQNYFQKYMIANMT